MVRSLEEWLDKWVLKISTSRALTIESLLTGVSGQDAKKALEEIEQIIDSTFNVQYKKLET